MRILLIVMAVLITVAAPSLAAEVDPLIWVKPAEPPEFREVIAVDEFKKRLREAITELGELKKLETSPAPDHGIKHHYHSESSQAASWKIQPGDLLTRAEPHDLWGGPTLNHERRRVTLFEFSTGRTRTVNAKAELFGIYFSSYWRPELAYLRSPKLRRQTWDEYVVIGCHYRELNPDFAETAWFHALKAGYPRDALTNICGAIIALDQGRSAVAADFAWLARAAEPNQPKFVSPVALLRVMLANYKLEDAYELCQRFPSQLTGEPRLFHALAELHRSRSAAERFAAPPSQIAQTRYKDDLLDRCFPLTTFAREYLPKLCERNGVIIDVVPGIHVPIALAPPQGSRDLEISVKYTVLAVNKGDSESQFEVNFFPNRPLDAAQLTSDTESRAVTVMAHVDSRVILRHGHDESFGTPIENPYYPLVLNHPQEIRLVRVAGQVEAFINGNRVLYQPLIPVEPADLAVIIRPNGIRVRIESISFNELLERR